jgi:hypothetical protein
MTDDQIGDQIEGLSPWVSSGDLQAFVAIFAKWIDAAHDDIVATLTIHQWGVHDRPHLDLKSWLAVDVLAGDKGYMGHAEVKVWSGSRPGDFRAMLDRAAEAAMAGNAIRKSMGPLHVVGTARFVMEPER